MRKFAVAPLDDRPLVFSCDFPAEEVPHPSPWLRGPRGPQWLTAANWNWRSESFDKPDSETKRQSSFLGGLYGRQLASLDRMPFGYHYKLMRVLSARLKGLIELQKDEILDSSHWRLIKSEETPEADEVLEFTKFAMQESEEAADWDSGKRDMLNAGPDGFSAVELKWMLIEFGKWAGKWLVRSVEHRDMWNFAFRRTDDGPVLSVRTPDGLVPAPPVKILAWSQGGGSPWGTAELDSAWTEFVSSLKNRHHSDLKGLKWAQPSGGCAVKFMEGDPDDQEVKEENKKRLREAQMLAATLHSNAAQAWDGEIYTPQFLSVQMPGDAHYGKTLEDNSSAAAFLLRGEVQMSGAGRPGAGARASDEVVRQVARVRVKLRREALKRRLNRFLRLFTAINFGPEAPPSRYEEEGLTEDERGLLMEGIRLNDEFGRSCPENHLALVTAVPDPAPGEKCRRCRNETEGGQT